MVMEVPLITLKLSEEPSNKVLKASPMECMPLMPVVLRSPTSGPTTICTRA